MLDHPHIIKLYQVSCKYYLYGVYLYFFFAVCGWVGTFVVKDRRLTWQVFSQMCTSLHLWPLSSIRSDNLIWNYRKFNSALSLIEKHQQSSEEKNDCNSFFLQFVTASVEENTIRVYTQIACRRDKTSVISALFFKCPCHVLFLSISARF